ncbi:MAG: glutaredoxin family protein [Methylotenera sp.]
MRLQLLLYTTSHCHLCEQAESMLCALSTQVDLDLTRIEIAEDEVLLTLYGTKIPVIKRQDNNLELGWPFAAVELKSFIQ